MKTRLILAAVAATASLAACGSDSPDPASAGNDQAKMRKALLDYSRCMRENGIDMPDPKFEGNRVTHARRRPGAKARPIRTR